MERCGEVAGKDLSGNAMIKTGVLSHRGSCALTSNELPAVMSRRQVTKKDVVLAFISFVFLPISFLKIFSSQNIIWNDIAQICFYCAQ